MGNRPALSARTTGLLMSALVLLPGMGLVITQQRTENRCGRLLQTQRQVNRWTNQRKPFVVDVALTKSDGSTVNTRTEVFGKIQVSKAVTTAPDTSSDTAWLLVDSSASRFYESSAVSGDWPAQWTILDRQPIGLTPPDFGLNELIRQCEKRNGITLDGGFRFENPIAGDVEFMRVTASLDPRRIEESRKRLASFRACRNAGTSCSVEQLRV